MVKWESEPETYRVEELDRTYVLLIAGLCESCGRNISTHRVRFTPFNEVHTYGVCDGCAPEHDHNGH